MNGWFAMNRAMFRHPLFEGKPERVAAWAWILASAAWKDTEQNVNGTRVAVRRGQLLTSYRQMSAATGVTVKVLRTLINGLKVGNAVGVDVGTGRMLITIRNYDKYQTPPKDQGTGEGKERAQQGHTKEQDNKKTIPPSEEAAASQPVEVSVVTTALWSAGKQYLASQQVKNPGSLIGRWLKHRNPVEILNAIEAAQKSGTQDPVPYITEVLKGEIYVSPGKANASNRPENRPDPALEQIARLAGLSQTQGAGGCGA